MPPEKKPYRAVEQLSCAIVATGYWNRMIFTPWWVADKLFGSEEGLMIELPLMPADPVVFKTRDVILRVAGNRLVFEPTSFSNPCVSKAEQMAVAALGALPDTPIIAMGVNFTFVLKKTTKNDGFSLHDESLIKKRVQGIAKTDVTRMIIYDDKTLYLNLSKEDDTMKFIFNFHADTEPEPDRKSSSPPLLSCRV